MREFVSWIEKGNGSKKVYYLTTKQINSKKGRELLKGLPYDDLIGHGAIRRFYGLEQDEGENKECTNFSSPDNFPTVIAKAIKNGEFRGMAEPKGLLTAVAWKAYKEALDTAERAYAKATAPAERAYAKALAPAFQDLEEAKAVAEKAYKEAKDTAEKAFAEAKAVAWKAYKETLDTAERAYAKATAPAFWDLFANPDKRVKAWR